MARRRSRRQAQRRRLCPDHPHLQLLSEAAAAAAERVRGCHRRESGGGGLLLGIGLELLNALTQLGDVGGGVGEDGCLVHPGHGGHGGPELAEEAVELVPPLPLRLHMAEGGAVDVVAGPWFPATPLQRRCCRFAGQVVVARRARALLVVSGVGERGRGRTAAGGGREDQFIHWTVALYVLQQLQCMPVRI